MAGNDPHTDNPHPFSARFFLWTVRKQDQISRIFTLNIWAAISAVLVCTLIGLVSLEKALQVILWGGIAAGGCTWILIERRRSWLLGITDPKLRADAHQVMIDYLSKRLPYGPDCSQQLNGSDACPTA